MCALYNRIHHISIFFHIYIYIYAHKGIHELAAIIFFHPNSPSCNEAKGAPFLPFDPSVNLNYITWNLKRERERIILVMGFSAVRWELYRCPGWRWTVGWRERIFLVIWICCHVACDNLKLMLVYPWKILSF